MKNKKGFTLVELLAVIVILAIILVIAVPKILDTIENAKISSMESSAKLVASALETYYQTSLATGSSMPEGCMGLGNLDTNEYENCTYTITDGKAQVTLTGKDNSRFSNYKVTDGTKTVADAIYQLECQEGYHSVGKTSRNSSCVINSYTLTVDLDGGTCSSCATTTLKDSGSVVNLGTPSKTDYNFTGWSIISGNASLSGKNLTIGTSDVTVKAMYQLAPYNIVLHSNGGYVSLGLPVINVTPGDAYGQLPDCTYYGKTFVGWFTEIDGGTQVLSTDHPTSSGTIYAHYEEDK